MHLLEARNENSGLWSCSPKEQWDALRLHLCFSNWEGARELILLWKVLLPSVPSLWQLRRAKAVPSVICRLAPVCASCAFAAQLYGWPKAPATAHTRGESPRELQNLWGLLTFTSPPVAVSTALQTFPKALETKEQERKEKPFWRWSESQPRQEISAVNT